MKTVIIESSWIRPHLETSGEILLTLLKKKENPKFAWVGNNLNWNDYSIPKILYLLGCSPERRVENFIKLLKNKNIKTINIDDKFDKKSIYKWSESFNGNIHQLKKFKYKNIPLGMGVASSLISQTNNRNFNTKIFNKKINKFLFSSAIVYERTIKVLEEEHPDRVITFNNRLGLSLPIVLACNQKNINVLRHDRGSNYKKYFLYNYDINDPRNFKNIYKEWKTNKSKDKVKIAKKFFEKKFNGTFLDEVNKNFTVNQKKNSIPSIPDNKKIVTFYCSTEYETDAYINLRYNQMKAFRRFFKVFKKFKNIFLIIRVHPSLVDREDLKWKKFESKNVIVVGAKSCHDTYEIMKKSDVVCAYTSRIVLESAFLAIPTICLRDFGWPKNLGILYGEDFNNIYKNLKKCLQKKTKFNLEKILSVSYFYSTYGKYYKYYKPFSLNKGTFLNQDLEWKSKIIIFLETLGIKKIYFMFKNFIYKELS